MSGLSNTACTRPGGATVACCRVAAILVAGGLVALREWGWFT